MQVVKESDEVIQTKSNLLIRYIYKMKGYKRTTPLVAPVPFDIILSLLGTIIGISAIVILSHRFDMSVMASFGASAVLVFGVPDAPMAQPRNVIFGHTLSAVAGVVTVVLFGLTWWSPAVGTALALLLMLLTKTTHPPGGATALFAVLSQEHFSYVFTPVMAGAVILVIIGLVFNNLSPNRHYPRYWY